MTGKSTLRSLAGHVLATGEATDDEAKRLAAGVLGDDSLTPAKPTKTKEELQALLAKIEGVEGQAERAALIRQQLALFDQD